MSLTVSMGGGDGYGQVLVNQEGVPTPDDYKAFRRIGSFALEYKAHVWKNPARPWARDEPNTTPTTGDWSLTTPANDQQYAAAIVSALIADKADALAGWNRDKERR